MKTPLEIEIPLTPSAGEQLLSDIGAPAQSHKVRKLQLTNPETNRVSVVVIQPGQVSPNETVSLRFAMDMSSAWVRHGFTCNVVRKFIPVLAEIGISLIAPQLSAQTVEELRRIAEENLRIIRISGSYFFDFKSETAALDAFFRMFKHAKTRLDCPERYPSARRSHAAPAPRVVPLTSPRCAFSIELIHYPFGQSFGDAQVSLMRDVWDMPRRPTGTEVETWNRFIARAKQVLRVDVSVDSKVRMPTSDGSAFVIPAPFSKLQELQTNLFQDIWSAFTWATWVNEAFTNGESDLAFDLGVAEQEVFDAYIAGENLTAHRLLAGNAERLLEIRRTLLKKAGVDVLVPWAAAQLCESAWLKPRLEYEQRIDPSKDELLAPLALCAANADDAIAKLRSVIDDGAR